MFVCHLCEDDLKLKPAHTAGIEREPVANA